LSLVGSGENKNGRCGNRTHDPLIKSQQAKNHNCPSNNDLQESGKAAYKPAYKDNPKTGQNQVKDLPADLAEIVSVWPQLSEAIRLAIVGLVRASNNK
jgi:hypothetical protein